MISRLNPSTGKLLVSEPFMNDPNFTRSVVLLTAHGEEGTVGFVINQPSALLIHDLIPDFDSADFPVYLGGPVATDTVHFIHRCPDKISGGEEIGKGIFWGGNFEALKAQTLMGAITQAEVKFFVGYSGWARQQLNGEISANTWIVSNQFDGDLVFSGDEESLWREVIINLGPKYAHISNFPRNPGLN